MINTFDRRHGQPKARQPPVTTSRRTRPPYRAARAFFLTLCICTCLAAFAFLSHDSAPPQRIQGRAVAQGNGASPFQTEDEECRLVRLADDQCAFIKAHCPKDEGGFAAILDFFYCRLGHVKPVAFFILVVWLALLFSTIGIAASDFFCVNLSTIAAILGMSESMAGVTFLAFGNGSPDVFSTFAAMSTNSGSLAVGELFGAAGFITAVVAGSMALIRPFQVAKKSFIRDVGFFAVAAAFSMVFLWDGKLHFWECAVMVGFYLFYVAFVVCWHWWLGRRRRRREAEAAARGQYIVPADELELEYEEHHDDPADRGHSRSNSILSFENWPALESGDTDRVLGDDEEDDEEEARERWMGELSSNMRLTRPTRSRANTANPVRPSLVGALEFQAVLKSLQKSRNIQTIPLNARRYSDDPTFTTAQQQEFMSTTLDPASRPPFQVVVHEDASPAIERPISEILPSGSGRTRSVSASHVLHTSSERYGKTPNASGLSTPEHPTIPGFRLESPHPSDLDQILEGGESPDASENVPDLSRVSPSGHLAPPRIEVSHPQDTDPTIPNSPVRHQSNRSIESVRSVPCARQLPKIRIPREERRLSPNTSPSLRYTASPYSSRAPSLYLPEAMPSPEPVPSGHDFAATLPRPLRWWPYESLPPPGVLLSTLFPTLSLWREKNWWARLLGVVAAPSVFLLTITLPVIENEKESESANTNSAQDQDRFDSSEFRPEQARSKAPSVHYSQQIGSEALRSPQNGVSGHGNVVSTAITTELEQRHNIGHPDFNGAVDSPIMIGSEPAAPSGSHRLTPEPWNRWLTIIQIYLAPIFTVLAVYIQSPTDLPFSWITKSVLICLLVSTVLLIPFLLTTTATRRPGIYTAILSFAGFIVSIAWISTIASQVVGALKALAVILNMSHAIMGLTIFAVGNSLGDLVADVTVAKLGYPVMALSACFGGPMLNILLGVGLSGGYILLRGAQHHKEKHPGKGMHFKSYEIEVSNTLIVSGATLLVTLVGLLVFVPLNRWVMSKRIGWALIVLWTLSTIGNVVLEVTGLGEGNNEG